MRIVLIILFLSIALNVVFGYLVVSRKPQLPQQKFALVSPIVGTQIDSNVQTQQLILHYQELRPVIESEITQASLQNNVGVFLQDVKTGAWLGINEKDGFVPASLMKIPLMMAVLKKVERKEIQLTDKITLLPEDLNEASGDLYLQGAGATLTVWDLLKYMVLSSDNTAKNAIKRQLLPVEINAVFAHVGMANPYDVNEPPEVTPRGFARIFKSLYLSSFLNPELSQRALDLTTDTQVENLISAGVPSEVQVAHKYGERSDGLGDCGIVYHPKNPYYLCIMTRTTDLFRARELIKAISHDVYEYVDSRDKAN